MYKSSLLRLIIAIIVNLLLFSCGANSPKGGVNISGVINGAPDEDRVNKPSAINAHNKAVTIDGIERKFSLYIPPNLTDGASIIFLFHGSTKLGISPISRYKVEKAKFNKIARNNNIIMVYPEGIERYGELKWDYMENSSDIKLFDAITSYLKNDFKNDYTFAPNIEKLYVTGYSAGAIFSFTLAGYRANKIAAVTPMSGQIALTNREGVVSSFITDNISTPLRAYNGTKDTRVKYASAYDNMKKWQEKENKGKADNFTTSNIQIERIMGNALNLRTEQYDVNITKWQDGISDLELYSLQGIGHFNDYGNLAESMWEFMKKYKVNIH